ncbi:MAG: cyclic pyranopterin monophosphate synthase MoaC [Dehalococcoidia bacterium]
MVAEDPRGRREAKLSHVDSEGNARMVDVSAKAVTTREATARGRVTMLPSTLEQIVSGVNPKGDVLAVARVAGIMAAKRTHDLIPLCHPLPISGIEVRLIPVATVEGGGSALDIEATVRTSAQTGVEMEALTAVSVAALTVYDMCKAVERGMTIEGVRLVAKSGGASGDYRAE